MREIPDSSIPPARQKIALTLRRFGWISFWTQLILGVISTLILVFAGFTLATPQPDNQAGQGIGFGLFFVVCGLVALGIGIYFAYRYTGIASRLLAANGSNIPSKAQTLQTIRLGLIVSLVGMLLTIIGSFAVIGSLVALALAEQQNPVGLACNDVPPIDLFVVQANINTIFANFVGIAISLWLFNRVSR